MLRDSAVNVLDWDEFRNVLNVQVSTKGVDTTLLITRTVKNDIVNWRLSLPNTQTECSTATAADGLTSAQKTAGKVNAPKGHTPPLG